MTFTVRDAVADDIPALAQIHVRGWQAAYAGMIDQKYLDSLSTDEKEKNWEEWLRQQNAHYLAAVNDQDRPVGFLGVGPLRTPPPGMSPIRPLYATEIYAVYILPEYWRQGIGRLLFGEAAKAIRAMKQKSTCLWVVDKNVRANAFYKQMGGERCGKKDIEIGPSKVRETCYGWRDVSRFAPAADMPRES